MSKFCSKPFEWFEVHPDGNVSMCCYTWLPAYIGQIGVDEGINDVFNSDISEEIRKSILDGSFRYCDHDLCPFIQAGDLPEVEELEGNSKRIVEEQITTGLEPTFYNLCYDESCNLSCPSCRVDKILFSKGPRYRQRKVIQDRIIKDLFEKYHERDCTVSITGSGDPFGSKLFRDLLFSVDGKNFPNMKINLQTNGVMFTEKYWNKMHRIQNNIESVLISFDAASPASYSYTRRDGNWDRLQDNMKFICQLRKDNKIKDLRCDFVVQQKKYHEMPSFVDMCLSYDFVDEIYFSQIVNWGTYSEEEFKEHAIHQEDHPEYDDFISIMQDTRLAHSKVNLGNLFSFRKKI